MISCKNLNIELWMYVSNIAVCTWNIQILDKKIGRNRNSECSYAKFVCSSQFEYIKTYLSLVRDSVLSTKIPDAKIWNLKNWQF